MKTISISFTWNAYGCTWHWQVSAQEYRTFAKHNEGLENQNCTFNGQLMRWNKIYWLSFCVTRSVCSVWPVRTYAICLGNVYGFDVIAECLLPYLHKTIFEFVYLLKSIEIFKLNKNLLCPCVATTPPPSPNSYLLWLLRWYRAHNRRIECTWIIIIIKFTLFARASTRDYNLWIKLITANNIWVLLRPQSRSQVKRSSNFHVDFRPPINSMRVLNFAFASTKTLNT